MSKRLPPDTPIEVISALLEKALKSLKENKNENGKDFICMAYKIISGLDRYTIENSSNESEQLRKLEELTLQIDWKKLYQGGETKVACTPVMLTGHLQGQFLKFLVSSIGAKRVLEIGMFSGYATLAMAEALPSDGKIITCEIDTYVAELAREYLEKTNCGHKIEIQVKPALETLQDIKARNLEPFDFIFVDADKENYIHYYNYILDQGLLSAAGTMCFDNTLMKGAAYAADFEHIYKRSIVKFNQTLKNDVRTYKLMLPIRDGITLVKHSEVTVS